jgi:catechol 2,3-dioxygenase-like lactoylglutathione lyase family enzyme
MLTGVDHVTIVVRDVEAAAARQALLLGFGPSWRGIHPELGTRSVLFGLGNTLLELVGPEPGDERAQGLRDFLDHHGEGVQTLAFATDDAVTCRQAWRDAGLKAAPVETGEARSLDDGSLRGYASVQLSPRDSRGLNVLVVQRDDLEGLRAGSEPRGPNAVHALDHVVIRTAAPDATLALYRDKLGIRLALDRMLGTTRMLFLRTGKVTLEVVQDPACGDTDSFWGLAYRVTDITSAHSRLTESGFALATVREGNKPGTQVFTVRDSPADVPTLILFDPSRS